MDDLTDLQLAVMKALWGIGEGGVGDVQAAMAQAGRSLAPTTVATLLQRLAKQGWVARRRNGRQFIYRAKVKEATAAKTALARVVRSFFGGSIPTVAAQLLDAEEIDDRDLRAIRELLDKKGG